MDAITFFALSAATAAAALLVAAAGVGFVLWAAAAVVAKSLRMRGAARDARHGPLAHGRPT